MPHRGVTLPEDVARWDDNCANNEQLRARRQKRLDSSAARAAARAQEEETPSEPQTS
jgi:hypothetical protein